MGTDKGWRMRVRLGDGVVRVRVRLGRGFRILRRRGWILRQGFSVKKRSWRTKGFSLVVEEREGDNSSRRKRRGSRMDIVEL